MDETPLLRRKGWLDEFIEKIEDNSTAFGLYPRVMSHGIAFDFTFSQEGVRYDNPTSVYIGNRAINITEATIRLPLLDSANHTKEDVIKTLDRAIKESGNEGYSTDSRVYEWSEAPYGPLLMPHVESAELDPDDFIRLLEATERIFIEEYGEKRSSAVKRAVE